MKVPEYLNKVKSDKKVLEAAAILDACHPTHSERLWLCGFLRYCGYSMTEVTNILHDHNHWCDYDVQVTAYQVGTIFKQRPQRTQNHYNTITPKTRKWSLSPLEVLKIRYQKSISLSKILCEESKAIAFPHPERLGNFNSWFEFLKK